MNKGQKSIASLYNQARKIVTQHYRNFKRDLALVLIIILLISAINSTVPILLRETANQLSTPNSESLYALIIASAYALTWTLSNIFDWIKSIATSHVMVRCDSAFYKSLFNCFINIPFQTQQSLTKGEIVSDFDRSMTSFGLINQTLFWILTPLIFELIFVFFILWQLTNLTLSAAFIISIVTLLSIAIWISKKTKNVHLKCFESTNNLTEFLIEKIDASYEISINSSQQKELNNLEKFIKNYANSVFNANTRMAILLSTQVAAIGLMLLCFTLTSAFLTKEGKFSVGDFVMIVSYIVQLTAPFAVIASSLVSLKRDCLALNEGLKYFKLISPPIEYQKEFKKQSPLFEIRNFRLKKTKPINISIEEGRIYAICGPSGCGKTTLINSIIGLNNNYSGIINLKGSDIKNFSPKEITKLISIVPQNPFIFSGTVRENLLYGVDSCINDEQLLSVIESLDLDLSNKDKHQTLDLLVGGENRPLSGGERQRIAIARAILRNKDCMILDEPTSGLDHELELKTLKYLKSNVRTLIIITHREAPKSIADEEILIQTEIDIHSKNNVKSIDNLKP